MTKEVKMSNFVELHPTAFIRFVSILSSLAGDGELGSNSSPGLLYSNFHTCVSVRPQMIGTVVEHKDGGQSGGLFSTYEILRVSGFINNNNLIPSNS